MGKYAGLARRELRQIFEQSDVLKAMWNNHKRQLAGKGLKCRGNELTRSSSGTAHPQSSQLAEPLWTGPGLKIKISARELIFA